MKEREQKRKGREKEKIEKLAKRAVHFPYTYILIHFLKMLWSYYGLARIYTHGIYQFTYLVYCRATPHVPQGGTSLSHVRNRIYIYFCIMLCMNNIIGTG